MLKNPMQWAEGYSMDLYCDHCSRRGQFAGKNRTHCLAQSVASGWRVYRATCTATCKACKKGAKP